MKLGTMSPEAYLIISSAENVKRSQTEAVSSRVNPSQEVFRLAFVSPRRCLRHHSHLATVTLKVTVLAPPAFVMTNLYCPSFVGVTLTEHFGPGESSLATSAPEES
jgi:hypothetical protein